MFAFAPVFAFAELFPENFHFVYQINKSVKMVNTFKSQLLSSNMDNVNEHLNNLLSTEGMSNNDLLQMEDSWELSLMNKIERIEERGKKIPLNNLSFSQLKRPELFEAHSTLRGYEERIENLKSMLPNLFEGGSNYVPNPRFDSYRQAFKLEENVSESSRWQINKMMKALIHGEKKLPSKQKIDEEFEEFCSKNEEETLSLKSFYKLMLEKCSNSFTESCIMNDCINSKNQIPQIQKIESIQSHNQGEKEEIFNKKSGNSAPKDINELIDFINSKVPMKKEGEGKKKKRKKKKENTLQKAESHNPSISNILEMEEDSIDPESFKASKLEFMKNKDEFMKRKEKYEKSKNSKKTQDNKNPSTDKENKLVDIPIEIKDFISDFDSIGVKSKSKAKAAKIASSEDDKEVEAFKKSLVSSSVPRKFVYKIKLFEDYKSD